MNDLLLHSSTKSSIERFLTQPAHAVLITGPEGSGKGTVASAIAGRLLKIDRQSLHDHPYTLWFRDQPITIENIRVAQKRMQLKVPGTDAIRRVVITEQAQTMSLEAQNAFLKLLEEPPADTVIILTASDTHTLLPTIRSRVQTISILPASKEDAITFFKPMHSQQEIEKAYYLSEGYVGLAYAILEDDNSHPLVNHIQTAKQLLASDTFSRLAQIDAITKEKQVSIFLKALERICHAALIQSATKASSATEAWKHRLQAVVQAQESLTRNPSTKLLLTNLLLRL